MDEYKIKRILLKFGARTGVKRPKTSAISCKDSIFIWIPKVAGTSVYYALAQMGMRKFKSYDKARYLFDGKGLVTFDHMSVSALVNEGVLSSSFVNGALKFGFSRNPYDRLVSMFHYYLKKNRVSRDLKFEDFLRQLILEWEKDGELGISPVENMSDRLLYTGEEYDPNITTLQSVGVYNVWHWSQCRRQVDWYEGLDMSNGFIGRIENINEDMRKIISILFEDDEDNLNKARELFQNGMPRVNTTERGDFNAYYKDFGLKREMERIYASDFEAFNY